MKPGTVPNFKELKKCTNVNSLSVPAFQQRVYHLQNITWQARATTWPLIINS